MSGNQYKIPSMSEIENIKKNGFNVASTFSGCGGSCLGYKMSGYNVLYANEFIPEAQKTYRANFSTTFLDTRDIRKVKPEEILEVCKLKKGELDILDGSPPCASFSTAGKREKHWGEIKSYSDTKQRTDDLFYEYIRILDGIKPKVFVAENVKGLTTGKAKGMFKEFMQQMESCGYNVSAQVINAMYLGVPQSRERVIFIGVRKDLDLFPPAIKPINKIVTIGMALKGVKNNQNEVDYLNQSIKKYKMYEIAKKLEKNPIKKIPASKIMNGSYFNLIRESMYEPCSTICQMIGCECASGNLHPLYDRKFTSDELKRLSSFPDDFVLTGNFRKKCERIGRAVPPLMMYHISKAIQKEVLEKL